MPDSNPDAAARAATLLEICRTAALATSDPGGLPHAANVQYALVLAASERVRPPWYLAWVSSPRAQHSLHLARSPRAAVTVYHPDDADPAALRGVQMRGGGYIVEDGRVLQDIEAAYLAKFPFIAREPFASAAARQRYYRFVPRWLRVIDNREGFGSRVEVELDAQ